MCIIAVSDELVDDSKILAGRSEGCLWQHVGMDEMLRIHTLIIDCDDAVLGSSRSPPDPNGSWSTERRLSRLSETTANGT